MSVLRSSWLVIVAAVLAAVLFYFRPGGVSGPAPPPRPPPETGFDHGAFTAVLQAVVGEDGLVDYGRLRAEPGPLDLYLGQLRATSPASAPHRFKTDEDRLAYYLNAYNAFVLAGVREACPIDSVQDAYVKDGFFWRVSYLMGEDRVTLGELKDTRIREVFRGNPAVHLVLVPAARGSPPLERTAFEGADVHARLEAAAARVAHDPRFVRREGDALRLSTLFKWHALDFGEPIAWVARYHPEAAAGTPTVDFLPYDGSLNGTCGGR